MHTGAINGVINMHHNIVPFFVAPKATTGVQFPGKNGEGRRMFNRL